MADECRLLEALVNADRLVLGQIDDDELVVADLYNGRDRFVRIFGGLRLCVIHLVKRARDTVGAISGLLVHIHENNVDIDQSTHSL